MNLLEKLQYSLQNHIQTLYQLTPEHLCSSTFELQTQEQKQQFGHISWNIALPLSKLIKQNPRTIAQTIIDSLDSNPQIERIEIAGPGFLNFFLSQDFLTSLAQEILTQGTDSFKPTLTKKHHYSLEFVSANPTGPLHLGHGRGGIIGDVLARVLRFIGHHVTTEFYINDAGSQIEKLGNSLKIRCMQITGSTIELPEDSYHGEYLKELALQCINSFGPQVIDKPVEFFATFAKNELLHFIKKTLHDYNIDFTVWFSEKTLHENGKVAQTLEMLKELDLAYTKENALWFKSSSFGDEKDRVLQKSSGEYTYLAADVAYLNNKLERGFDKLIMILGQDHHSYAVRMQALITALHQRPDDLEVILYQLVSLKEDNLPVRMSKRTGKAIGLQDVIDTVSTDVARFFYLNRKADAHLEFDIGKALKKNEENPVYYIQYAYVRAYSILTKAESESALQNITSQDIKIKDPESTLLLLKIIELKNILASINYNHQTHLLAYYAYELAQTFHHYYRFQRVIDMNNTQESRQRLTMILLAQKALNVTLSLLGVQAPTSM